MSRFPFHYSFKTVKNKITNKIDLDTFKDWVDSLVEYRKSVIHLYVRPPAADAATRSIAGRDE